MSSEELLESKDVKAAKKREEEELEAEAAKTSIEATFDVGDQGTDKVATQQEISMNAWVQQQLKEDGSIQSEEVMEENKDRRSQLFEVEERFQASVAQNKNRASEESTWLTGITEVQLPVDYKLKNIQATEAAKQALLVSKRLEREEESDLPSNLTANYKHHRREHYLNVIAPNNKGQSIKNAQGLASDESVMERFKKRQRSRKW